MAINFGNRAQNNNQQQQNDSWRSDAFINVLLPRRDGSTGKLGAIALKLSNESQKELIEWLNADSKNIEILQSRIKLDFRMADAKAGGGFDLG